MLILRILYLPKCDFCDINLHAKTPSKGSNILFLKNNLLTSFKLPIYTLDKCFYSSKPFGVGRTRVITKAVQCHLKYH